MSDCERDNRSWHQSILDLRWPCITRLSFDGDLNGEPSDGDAISVIEFTFLDRLSVDEGPIGAEILDSTAILVTLQREVHVIQRRFASDGETGRFRSSDRGGLAESKPESLFLHAIDCNVENG